MFALLLTLIFSNASDNDRMPEISLDFHASAKVVCARDSVKVSAPPVKIDIVKVGPTKIASKPNPDLVIVW